MKNSPALVGMILVLSVLGCVLPTQVSEEATPEARPAEQRDTSDETQELKDKIAELEKKKLEEKIDDLEKEIDEQKNAPVPKNPKTTSGSRPPKGFGRVNSPRDGFLALRNVPSVDRGVRLAKIPHGKTIEVWSCGGKTRLNGRTGRWCQVLYRNTTGYVFDAYLIR